MTLAVSSAGTLPNYAKSPWYKTYHGYHYRDLDVILSTDGEVYLYPLVEKKRVPKSKAIKIRVVVEYKSEKSHKWVKRKHIAKGYEVKEKAGIQRAKSEIIATVTGKVQYKLNLTHDKKGLTIGGSFLKSPNSDKAKYRLTILSEIPDLYNLSANGKSSAVRAKLRGDGATLKSLNKKQRDKRYRLNQIVKLDELKQYNLKSFKLKAKRYGKAQLTWSLPEIDKGKLTLSPKYAGQGLHKGFSISTVLVDESGLNQSSGMRIEVR